MASCLTRAKTALHEEQRHQMHHSMLRTIFGLLRGQGLVLTVLSSPNPSGTLKVARNVSKTSGQVPEVNMNGVAQAKKC